MADWISPELEKMLNIRPVNDLEPLTSVPAAQSLRPFQGFDFTIINLYPLESLAAVSFFVR